MSPTATTPAAPVTAARSRGATTLLVANAAVAWTGVAISLTLALTGNNKHLDPARPTQIGTLAAGVATPLERLFDWLSYFTIWSNVLVAIVLTVLVARPALFARSDRVGTVWRALRLDSVLMIVVTGLVFNLLLAKGGLTGWPLASNTFVHVITPILTTLVWLIAGPRGLLSNRIIAASLVVPLVYVVWALARGAAIGAYPYPFLDVAVKGYPSVLAFVAGLIVFAVLLAYLLWAVDSGLRRLVHGSRALTAGTLPA